MPSATVPVDCDLGLRGTGGRTVRTEDYHPALMFDGLVIGEGMSDFIGLKRGTRVVEVTER